MFCFKCNLIKMSSLDIRPFYTSDSLTCRKWKSTGVTNFINDLLDQLKV